jgi:hypothetical protein
LAGGEVSVLSAGRSHHLPALAHYHSAGSSRAHINAEKVHLCLQISFGLARLHVPATPVNRG